MAKLQSIRPYIFGKPILSLEGIIENGGPIENFDCQREL